MLVALLLNDKVFTKKKIRNFKKCVDNITKTIYNISCACQFDVVRDGDIETAKI